MFGLPARLQQAIERQIGIKLRHPGSAPVAVHLVVKFFLPPSRGFARPAWALHHLDGPFGVGSESGFIQAAVRDGAALRDVVMSSLNFVNSPPARISPFAWMARLGGPRHRKTNSRIEASVQRAGRPGRTSPDTTGQRDSAETILSRTSRANRIRYPSSRTIAD